MYRLPKDIKQFELNYICACLHFCKIKTSSDLNNKFDYLIANINQNKDIFKGNYSKEECVAILQSAIKMYNDLNEYAIKMSEYHIYNANSA